MAEYSEEFQKLWNKRTWKIDLEWTNKDLAYEWYEKGKATEPARSEVEPEVKQLLADIAEHRNKLPKNWTWKKCYELEYKYVGIKKHWALQREGEKAVASYNLLLQDLTLQRDEIDKDEAMLFIEKSLEYIDCLLKIVSKQSV